MPILVLGEKRYEFDAGEFTAKEAIAIEKATGYDWQDFLGNAAVTPLGKLALAWMVLRHNGQPTLDFADVDFPMAAFDLEPDEEQLAALKAAEEAEANPPVAAGRGPNPTAGRRRPAGSKSSTGSPPPATST